MSKLNGGIVARRLILGAILTPLILGWLILQGYRFKLYDPAFAIALLVLLLIVVYVSLIWRNAVFLNKIDGDRQRVQQQIQQQAELLELAYEAIFARDINNAITYWNRGAEQTYGWTRTETTGRVSHELLQTQFPPDCNNIDTLLLQHEYWEGELTHTCKQGKQIVVESRQVLIRNSQGLPVGFLEVNRDVTERKQAEVALRQSEATIRHQLAEIDSIYQTAPIGLAILDNDLRYVRINQRLAQINGIPIEEHIGRTVREIVPDLADEAEPLFRRILETGEPIFNLEISGETAAQPGVRRTWIENWIPLKDADGRTLGINLVVQEISDRKRAEAALQESEERFRRAVVNAPFPIIIHAEDGEVVQISQAWTELSGYTRNEIPTIDIWTEKVYGAAKDEVKADIDRLYELEERIEEGEFLITTKHGEKRTWDFSSAPLGRLTDGRRLVISMAADVTDRKLVENALRQSEARLRLFVESDVIGILYDDVYGGISYANDAFLNIIGYTRADLEAGRIDWTEITPPEYLPLDAEKIAEAQAKGTCTPYEKEYIRKDGVRVFVILGYALLGENREQSVAFILDISDRKHLEHKLRKQAEVLRQLNETLEERVQQRTAQLEAANKELESFSYSVSHDLRAPLRHIAGFVDLLQKRIKSNPTLDATSQRYLTIVVETTQLAGKLIDDLLSFSRMGRMEMHSTNVDMNILVQEVLRDLELETKNRQISWQLNTLFTVQGDPAMLRLVLRNLIENALKYTRFKPQTEITIGSQISSQSQEVIFFVKDNGIGFDMQYVHKLFGVFQRLHSDPNFQGTGVGLANVQRIIHRHSGRVWAQGEVDKGATFYFSLPEMGVRGGE